MSLTSRKLSSWLVLVVCEGAQTCSHALLLNVTPWLNPTSRHILGTAARHKLVRMIVEGVAVERVERDPLEAPVLIRRRCEHFVLVRRADKVRRVAMLRIVCGV